MSYNINNINGQDGSLDKERPWPGLISFSEADSPFLFGRDREIVDLSRMVHQEVLTVFYGKSGLGKTSILRAGLTPSMRKRGYIPIYVRLNHVQKAPPLKIQLENSIKEVIDAEQIEAPRLERTESLWEYFHKNGCKWWDREKRHIKPILIFDQFEELLVVWRDNPDLTDAFLTELEELIENRPPARLIERFKTERGLTKQFDLDKVLFRVVLVLREDFFAELEELRERVRMIMKNTFRLHPMTVEQAMDVILKPGGHFVNENVANRIVDFVSLSERSKNLKNTVQTHVDNRQVDPALLSVVLHELNESRIDSKCEKITIEMIGDGQATKILEKFYERGLKGMADSVYSFMMDSLLTSSGARNHIAEDDALAKHGISAEIISKLIDRRIIQRQIIGEVKWIELAHDKLTDVIRAYREQETCRKFDDACCHAEKEAEEAVKLLWGELRNLFPGSAMRAVNAIKRFSSDATEFTTAQFKKSQVKLLVLAAEILYLNGHIKEGFDSAGEALKQVIDLDVTGISDNDLRLVRALAHYANGKGFYENGDLDEAEKHYCATLDLTNISTDSTKQSSQDETLSIHVLAQVGFGDVKLKRYSLNEARKIFKNLKELMEKENVTSEWDDDPLYWKVLALGRLGSAEEKNRNVQECFMEAREILNKMMINDPDNLRFSRLYAELAYSQSFQMMDSDSFYYYEIERQLQYAFSKTKTLYYLDEENLALASVLADIHRGFGMLYQKGGNMHKAYNSFKNMKELCGRIHKSQPSWFSNRYNYAISNYYLGNTFFEKENRKKKATEDVLKLYVESYSLLKDMIKDFPRYTKYIYSTAIVISGIGKYYVSQGEREKALDSYNKALELLEGVPLQAKSNPLLQDFLAWQHTVMVRDIFLPSYQLGNAIDSCCKAIQLYTDSVNYVPTLRRYISLMGIHLLLADAYLQTGKKEDASANFDLSIKVSDDGLKRFPNDARLLEQKTRSYWFMFMKWRKKGDFHASINALKNAVNTGKKSFDLEPVQRDLYILLKSIFENGEAFEKELRADLQHTGSNQNEGVKHENNFSELADQVKDACCAIDPKKLLLPPGTQLKDGQISKVSQQQNWTMKPLIPGIWKTLRPLESKVEIKHLQALSIDQNTTVTDIVRIRTLSLNFYDDAFLYEAELKLKGKINGIFCYVRCGEETLVLNGNAAPIHKFNLQGHLRLETLEQAAAYLCFFTTVIQAEEGTFRIVDSVDDLVFGSDVTQKERDNIERIIIPFQIKETLDGKWDARATMLYGDTLLYTLMQVLPGGLVKMDNENTVALNMPVHTERFVKGVRVITNYSIEKRRLSSLVGRATEEKKYSEAVEALKILIEFFNSNINDKADQKRLLPGKYLSLSWYQLHVKDFAGALASTEAGLKWDSEYLLLNTNRAHALIFLGCTKEAEQIYFKYIGKEIAEEQKPWEQVILDDFDELEKENISHPEFKRIRKLLKSKK